MKLGISWQLGAQFASPVLPSLEGGFPQFCQDMTTLWGPGAVVVAVIALIVAIWAIRERVRLRRDLENNQEVAQSRALALRDQVEELEALRSDRDRIKADFEAFVQFLVEAGVLRPDVDPLAASPDDVVYEISEPVPEFPDSNLERALAVKALEHAAARTGPRSDRPFSRRYMVDDGPLTRTEFEALRSALVAGGYLERPERPKAGYPLTDKGRALLRAV